MHTTCVWREADMAASRLAAMAHPTRLGILRHLAASGQCCCKDVVEQFDLAQSTVSQHLRILVDAGLVRFAPDRQRSRYEIDREAMAGLSRAVNDIAAQCCGGPAAE